MVDQNGIYLELKVEPEEGGGIYVHSKNTLLAGLHLIGKDFQSMKPVVEKAIKMLFRDNHQLAVRIIWLKDSFSTTAVCNVLERLAVIPEGAAAA